MVLLCFTCLLNFFNRSDFIYEWILLSLNLKIFLIFTGETWFKWLRWINITYVIYIFITNIDFINFLLFLLRFGFIKLRIILLGQLFITECEVPLFIKDDMILLKNLVVKILCLIAFHFQTKSLFIHIWIFVFF